MSMWLRQEMEKVPWPLIHAITPVREEEASRNRSGAPVISAPGRLAACARDRNRWEYT